MFNARTGKRTALALYLAALAFLFFAPLPHTAARLASVQGFDKAVHFGLFAGLAVLLHWDLLGNRGSTVVRVVGTSGLVAAVVELLQAPLPYRTADAWDFFWGLAGAATAYALVRRLSGEAPPAGP